jgi:hypothetical protein
LAEIARVYGGKGDRNTPKIFLRENGVRSLLVTCSNVTCRHEKIVNVDAYGDDLSVPSFGPRMRCERCGQRGADVRLNWNEVAPPSLFGAP